MSVMYLFTRVRFNWNEVNYSMFSTYSMITNLVGSSNVILSLLLLLRYLLYCRNRLNTIVVIVCSVQIVNTLSPATGTMFSVGVFSHMLQIDDALIGVMSCVSKILAGFVYAFATTDFVFYLGKSLIYIQFLFAEGGAVARFPPKMRPSSWILSESFGKILGPDRFINFYFIP